MSLEARNWARRIGGLSIAAKAALMALADHADAEGGAWPKLKTLAEITSMTERHVRRQIGVLEGRGLVMREDRFRKDGGQTSNIYRLAIELRSPSGPSTKDPPSRGRRTMKSDQGTPPEPSSSDIEESADKAVSDARAAFDQAFEAWKAVSPARLSRPKAWPLWRRFAQQLSPARLLAAALRYLREDPDAKRYGSPQGLANWLADEKFEAWAEPVAALVMPTPSCIPKGLLDAAMLRKGEAWVASWILPCRYDAVARVIYAKTAFAARTIASEMESLLRDYGVMCQPMLAIQYRAVAACPGIAN